MSQKNKIDTYLWDHIKQLVSSCSHKIFHDMEKCHNNCLIKQGTKLYTYIYAYKIDLFCGHWNYG